MVYTSQQNDKDITLQGSQNYCYIRQASAYEACDAYNHMRTSLHTPKT